jgi:hypothetical protein
MEDAKYKINRGIVAAYRAFFWSTGLVDDTHVQGGRDVGLANPDTPRQAMGRISSIIYMSS